MKKSLVIIITAYLTLISLTNCGRKNSDNKSALNQLDSVNKELESKMAELSSKSEESASTTDKSPSSTDSESIEANDELNSNDVHYDSYTFPKKYAEETLDKGPSHILDFRDRKNDKFIGVKFSDGRSGTLVLRDGHYYNYTIREKTEVRFASKEDGLQRIWDDCKSLQDAGAAIGGALSGKSGPRKKDGTLDMRYKENK